MHALAQKIDTIQRRLVWRARLAAACAIAAIILATTMLLGGLDYVIRYTDLGLRIMATLAWIAVAAWAVYRWRHLLRFQASPLTVARKIEARFPQLRDSLASAVEFLEQSEGEETAGSPQLRRLVVTEAQLAIDGLPLDEVIDRRPLRNTAVWFAMAAFLIGLWCLVDAAAVRTALVRLAAPFGATEWPRQHHLAFRDVPKRVAASQTFEVELTNTAGPLPADVRIEYREKTGAGSRTVSDSLIFAGDMAIARRENVQHSFAFRAEGGDDNTMPWHWVAVVQPPQLKSLQVVVHPPEYTGLPIEKAERHLEVLAGSQIELRGTASAPISAARILLDDGRVIGADIRGDHPDEPHRSFHVPPGRWVAGESGPYKLELTDQDGLAVTVGQWNLRVRPDTPPSVAWQQPSADLYVTAQAVVPVALAVHDDLAIQRIELVYNRSNSSGPKSETADTSSEVIELYRGQEKPVARPTAANSKDGESHDIDYTWDLAPLRLPVGAQLVSNAQAADYRPGIGRTVTPRRITIITPQELESLLAERQSRIVRQLEQALAAQRATREDVRRLEIAKGDADRFTAADRNTLNAAELSQRRIKTDLSDPLKGVAAAVDSILAEVEINRLTSSDLQAPMERLRGELSRMAGGPLSDAERELTAARKSADMLADQTTNGNDGEIAAAPEPADERFMRSLSQAGAAQDEVIESLEKLVGELSTGVDYRQIAQELATLREDQLAHAATTRSEIGFETLPLRPNELTRQQRAKLNTAAAGQEAIARRFSAFERQIDRLAGESQDQPTEQGRRLSEAADALHRSAIATDMQEVSRNLTENRIGQALEREREIADELEQVLDSLRDGQPNGPDQIAENLRAAEQRLAGLRQQLADLRNEIEQTEKQPGAANAERLAQLNALQQKLQQAIESLASDLDRIQAPRAAQSAQNAANRLQNQSNSDNQSTPQPQQPSPSGEVQQAEQDLQDAAHQLAESRQQAEDDLALEFVRQFQAELAEMVRRQQQVLDETVAIDSVRADAQNLTDEQMTTVTKLAGEERELASAAHAHSELLFGLGAVRVGLEDASRRLSAAAERLDNRDTGAAAQRAQRLALTRCEGMLQAFAQTQSEASPNNQNPGNQNAAPPGEQPQRRPTFALLEVKMLRMLQADLNERTSDLQVRLDGLGTPGSADERSQLIQEAHEIQAEQGRLANLVQEMLTRDNEAGNE